ncbi:hypothetical protein F4604DRAFT_1589754, partial [Suillus subluteus]
HCLFVSAFMLASKVICDDTYSNKTWSIVVQGMFQLRKINQMEHEICQYLERGNSQEPYPTYILPSSSKTTPPLLPQISSHLLQPLWISTYILFLFPLSCSHPK